MLGLDPRSMGVMVYADLAGQIDAGSKKVPKIYHAAMHPTRYTCPFYMLFFCGGRRENVW